MEVWESDDGKKSVGALFSAPGFQLSAARIVVYYPIGISSFRHSRLILSIATRSSLGAGGKISWENVGGIRYRWDLDPPSGCIDRVDLGNKLEQTRFCAHRLDFPAGWKKAKSAKRFGNQKIFLSSIPRW